MMDKIDLIDHLGVLKEYFGDKCPGNRDVIKEAIDYIEADND